MTALEFIEEKLKQLEAVETAATPWPWHSDDNLNIYGGGYCVAHCWVVESDVRPIEANTKLVIESRNNLLPLIRALRYVLPDYAHGGQAEEIAKLLGWRGE